MMTRKAGLVAVAVAIAVVGGSARSVHAHADLVSSTPAGNSVLQAGPAEIVIEDAFSFQVGAAVSVPDEQLIDQVGDVRSAPSVRWWYGFARFLSLAGAIGLLGGGFWLLQGEASLVSRRGPRRLLGVAWAAMLVGSLAAFGLFGAEAVAG